MKLYKVFLFCFFLSISVKAQLPNTDIWLLDYSASKDSETLKNPVNITNRDGYDNQPVFSPGGGYILYTSIRGDKQADIYKYCIKTKKTGRFTKTATSEYSPTYMPDGKSISVVMVEKDSTQRLWKFPIKGGKPSLILDRVDSIGYHTWINKDTLALFVLTQPFSLQIADKKAQNPVTVSTNIGRCFKLVPNQNALMFVNKTDNGWFFKTLHLKDLKILSDVMNEDIPTIEGSEDFIFTKSGLMMCKGAKIFSYSPVNGQNASWHEIADLSSFGINNITRIAISNDTKRIAIASAK